MPVFNLSNSSLSMQPGDDQDLSTHGLWSLQGSLRQGHAHHLRAAGGRAMKSHGLEMASGHVYAILYASRRLP